MTTLAISDSDWAKIHQRISREYPPSVLLIRSKMREVLSFTVRRHRHWNEDQGVVWQTYLDFQTQQAMTFFKLKYYNV